MKRGKVTIIVGGAWGSEAKGLACQHLITGGNYRIAVRTGAINAGHTVYDKGEAFAMCQLPVAWINQGVKLIVGGGAYVDPEVLDREVKMIDGRHRHGVRTVDRVIIDKRAYLHKKEFHEMEKGMHERMGSTAHGVSEAIKDKISRLNKDNLFMNSDYCKDNVNRLFKVGDTVEELYQTLERGQNVILEGTQGTFLDVHYGIDYPYVTSRQTIASAWLTEAGLPPVNVETVMVLRTMPIRVAGNSGPMPGEISWYHLLENMNIRRQKKGMEPLVDPKAVEALKEAENKHAKELGIKLPYDMTPLEREQNGEKLVNFHKDIFENLPEDVVDELRKVVEMTTVTKKVRRIATMSDDLLRYATRLNRPNAIFLNFLNYKFPEIWGIGSWNQTDMETREEIRTYLRHIEKVTETPIKWVSTAPNTVLETKELL